jgi:hypothetical protein
VIDIVAAATLETVQQSTILFTVLFEKEEKEKGLFRRIFPIFFF